MTILDEDTLSATEYLEMERQHPPRQIRIGDGVLVIDRPCTACKGSGVYWAPAWQEWQAKFTAFMEVCKTFRERDEWEAANPFPHGDEELPCPECDGHGRRLTDEGRTLMEAVSEWVLPYGLKATR